MRLDEAVALIAPALGDASAARGTWVDLGAGEGLFARAVARLLGSGSRVLAVDRDARALASVERAARAARAAGGATHDAEIRAAVADLADRRAVDALALPPLAGVVLANALHFVERDAQQQVLADWSARLAAGGRLIVVEYERRAASPWVPYPIAESELRAMRVPGLSPFAVVARRPSRYGGELYVAVGRASGA